MPTPSITPLPVLDRTAPTFRSDIDTYLGSQLPNFSTQINVLSADLTTKSAAATAAAALATESIQVVTDAAGTATTQAGLAVDARIAAGISAGNALAQADLAGTRATSAGAALGNAILARDAAADSAADSLVLRNQTEGIRAATAAIRDNASAIVTGDILGTEPTEFRNNQMNDDRFDRLARVELPAGTDPDSVVAEGKYILREHATMPAAGDWYLDVSAAPTTGYVRQEVRMYAGAPPEAHFRICIDGHWTEFVQYADTAYVDTVADTLAVDLGAKVGDLVQAVAAPNPSWKLADGATLLRSAYPELFDKIGTLPNSYTIVPPDNSGQLPTGAAYVYTNGIYANGIYVLVAGGRVSVSNTAAGGGVTNKIYTSTDGFYWTERTLPESRAWAGVAYGAGKFVLMSTYSTSGNWLTKVATSTDGITWAMVTTSGLGSTPVQDLAFGNGVFVATAPSGATVRSTNGTAWTAGGNASANNKMLFGNGFFVAWSSGDGDVKWSTDGLVWTASATHSMPQPYSYPTKFTFAGAYFFVLSGYNRQYAYSSDGKTWTVGNAPVDTQPASVTYAGGKYVMAVGGQIATATTPSNFTIAASSGVPGSNSNAPYTSVWMSSPAMAVVVATAPPPAGYSPNNYWTAGWEYQQGAVPNGDTIAYGVGRYVAHYNGTSGYIWSSADSGKTWQVSVLSMRFRVRAVRFAGGKFMALGDADGLATNASLTSTDGLDWIVQYLPFTQVWYSLAVADGVWVAVGGTTMYRATNGYTYAAIADPKLAVTIQTRVAGGAGKGFVAIVGGNTSTQAAWSADGTAWALYNLPGTAAIWNKVTFTGNRFVVSAGGNSRHAWSYDGKVWVEFAVLPGANSDEITFVFSAANGLYTAVNYNTARTFTTTDFVTWVDRGAGVTAPREMLDGGLRIVGPASSSYKFGISFINYDPALEFAVPDIRVAVTGSTPLNYYIKAEA